MATLKRRRVEAEFSGGEVTSDSSVLALRQADRHLGLMAAVAATLPDGRDQPHVQHNM